MSIAVGSPIYPSDLAVGTWSPTLTNLTLGSGFVLGRYKRSGLWVDFRFVFALGSGSAVGTDPMFTLPFAARGDYTSAEPIGSALLYDSGTARFWGACRLDSATVARPVLVNVGGTYPSEAQITSSVPFTWVSGDAISCEGSYEAAA